MSALDPSPAASYRFWINPNKINHLAERQINDLAHALAAYLLCILTTCNPDLPYPYLVHDDEDDPDPDAERHV